MAILSLEEIENVFYTLTLLNSNVPSDKIRHTYSPNSQPAFENQEDVIFIIVNLKDDQYDKNRHIQYLDNNPDEAEENIFYTRVLQITWICHGPHSFNNADNLRNKLLTREGRRILRQAGIFPLTDVPAPRRVPYMFNNQWWDRTDITAYFNLETLRVGPVPYIKTVPVELITEVENVSIIVDP